MKLLPFVTFPNAVQDVYHYFSLNNNNPLRVRYVNFAALQYEYTFEYVYTPDVYLTHINVYMAGFNKPNHSRSQGITGTINYYLSVEFKETSTVF